MVNNVRYRFNDYREQGWNEYPYTKYVTSLLLIGVVSGLLYRFYPKSSSDKKSLSKDKSSKRSDESEGGLKGYKKFEITKHTHETTKIGSDLTQSASQKLIKELKSLDEITLTESVKFCFDISSAIKDRKIYKLQFQDVYLLNSIIQYCKSQIQNLDYHWDNKGTLCDTNTDIDEYRIDVNRFKKYKDLLNKNKFKFEFGITPGKHNFYSILLGDQKSKKNSKLTGIGFHCVMEIFNIIVEERPSSAEKNSMVEMMVELKEEIRDLVRNHLNEEELKSLIPSSNENVNVGNDDQDDFKGIEEEEKKEMKRVMVGESDNESDLSSIHSDEYFSTDDLESSEGDDTVTTLKDRLIFYDEKHDKYIEISIPSNIQTLHILMERYVNIFNWAKTGFPAHGSGSGEVNASVKNKDLNEVWKIRKPSEVTDRTNRPMSNLVVSDEEIKKGDKKLMQIKPIKRLFELKLNGEDEKNEYLKGKYQMIYLGKIPQDKDVVTKHTNYLKRIFGLISPKKSSDEEKKKLSRFRKFMTAINDIVKEKDNCLRPNGYDVKDKVISLDHYKTKMMRQQEEITPTQESNIPQSPSNNASIELTDKLIIDESQATNQASVSIPVDDLD